MRAVSPTPRVARRRRGAPPLIALRVVSLPASTNSSQYASSCSSVSGAPSTVPWRSSLTRSSCGSRRRWSIKSSKIAAQLAPGSFHRLPGRLAGAAVLGIVLADDLVGPAEQQLPVGVRDAEDPGDDRERERRRDAARRSRIRSCAHLQCAASSSTSSAMRSTSARRARTAVGVNRAARDAGASVRASAGRAGRGSRRRNGRRAGARERDPLRAREPLAVATRSAGCRRAS